MSNIDIMKATHWYIVGDVYGRLDALDELEAKPSPAYYDARAQKGYPKHWPRTVPPEFERGYQEGYQDTKLKIADAAYSEYVAAKMAGELD